MPGSLTGLALSALDRIGLSLRPLLVLWFWLALLLWLEVMEESEVMEEDDSSLVGRIRRTMTDAEARSLWRARLLGGRRMN